MTLVNLCRPQFARMQKENDKSTTRSRYCGKCGSPWEAVEDSCILSKCTEYILRALPQAAGTKYHNWVA